MTKLKKKASAADVPLMILTNERTPYKAQMLLMLYKAASLAQLAYMDGVHPESGEIHQLLVGLEPVGDKGEFKVFPLARLFSKLDEIPKYLMPDGQGNYLDYSKFNDGSDKPSAPVEERKEDRPPKKGRPRKNAKRGTLGGSDATPLQRGVERSGNLPGTKDETQGVSAEDGR